MRKNKVLFFLSPGVGGAQRVSILFAKLLDPAIFEVVYVIVGTSQLGIVDFIPHNAVIRKIKLKNIFEFSTWKIFLLLKAEKPYAVFCSQMYLNNRVIIAAKLLGNIKIVIRSNSMIQNLKAKQMDFCLAKRLYRKADRVVAQTPEMRDEIFSVFKTQEQKTVVIYNPIDKQLIDEKIKNSSPYSSQDETRYVCVGRVDPVKGYEVVIKAMHEVLKDNMNAHLYIVGVYNPSSDYYKQLVTLVDVLHLSNNVHFVGYSDNPFVWVKNADVFVLSSYMEGLPNVLIEALYLHKPVVATKCVPVVNRIVEYGVNGYLVDCGDDVSMAKSMKKALEWSQVRSSFVGATNDQINKLFEFGKNE